MGLKPRIKSAYAATNDEWDGEVGKVSATAGDNTWQRRKNKYARGSLIAALIEIQTKQSMSGKKQFGVWMNSNHATVVSKDDTEQGLFTVIAHVKGGTDHGNSNEQNANNHERTLTTQFFKEIAAHMPNVDVLHITGTGQVQEQFAHYLAQTPQYKNTQTSDSTANKMSDEALLEYFAERLK